MQEVCFRSQDTAASTVLPSVHIAVNSGPGSPCAACAAHCVDDPAGDKVLCWILYGTKCTFSFVLSPVNFLNYYYF